MPRRKSPARAAKSRQPRMGDKAPAPDLTNGPSSSSGGTSSAASTSAPKTSPKAKASPAKGSKKRAASRSPPSRSPQIKRKRLPAEYYQSDVIEAISKSPSARTPALGKELFYDKGSYLAVRKRKW
ncbi:uncharacterized protein [Amphiura filiformis]|uniref:uncharacterized protein n=1 Tax=Amphiura filiformis TaxID=82378 RepID=UPI003B227809